MTANMPYPRNCAACDQEAVSPARISHQAEVKYDGKLHRFLIPGLEVDQCRHCGEVYFTLETDRQISDGLRTHLCLLRPQDIRARLKQLGIKQVEFAARIGVAKETVSRWLQERSIQNRAMDNLMRLFLGMDSVRHVLTERGPTERLGMSAIRSPAENCPQATMPWVQERRFPAHILARREHFQLRRLTGSEHAR